MRMVVSERICTDIFDRINAGLICTISPNLYKKENYKASIQDFLSRPVVFDTIGGFRLGVFK